MSAGTGTRLRPLTESIPKTLLEIDNITIIERMVKNLFDNGVDKFIFVVGHFKEKVIDFKEVLEDKYPITINIIENNQYSTTNTSVSTYLATKDLDDDFILINGDNIVDPKIITNLIKTNNTALVIDNSKDLNEESFKVIIDNNVVVDIGKGLDISKSSGEFIGLSKVIKEDTLLFNEILKRLLDDDPQNYYDLTYKQLSTLTDFDFSFTNGLKWTEIDDFNDWKIAQKLVKDFDKITFQ